MRSGLVLVALGAMLAGCNGGSAPVNNAAGPDPMANTASTNTVEGMERQINALNETERKTTFYKAIYDADYECGQIVSIEAKPRSDGKPVWLATCEDKGEYVITLQPGGIFTVSGVPQAKRRLPKGTTILPPGTK